MSKVYAVQEKKSLRFACSILTVSSMLTKTPVYYSTSLKQMEHFLKHCRTQSKKRWHPLFGKSFELAEVGELRWTY